MSTSPSPVGLTLADRLKPGISPFQEVLRQFACGLRIAVPGIIKSFNAATQTAVVQPAITDRIKANRSAENNTVTEQQEEMTLPLQTDVPVAFMRAGGFAITCPVPDGSLCILLVMDSCIDYHVQNGGVQSTGFKTRRHSVSDAVAFLADITQPNALSDVSTDSLQIRSDDGQTVVDVKSGQITLTATNVTINASDTATIQAETVNIEGSSAVNITGAGNTKIESTKWTTHQHTGVTSGGSDTGPVLP